MKNVGTSMMAKAMAKRPNASAIQRLSSANIHCCACATSAFISGIAASVAAAIPTCTQPNTRRGSSRRSTNSRVAALPSAMPTRNAASIVTKACVELPTTSTRTRVQTTSSASVTTPERPTATSKPASDCVSAGAGATSAAGRGSLRAARSKAANPMATFAATATQSVG